MRETGRAWRTKSLVSRPNLALLGPLVIALAVATVLVRGMFGAGYTEGSDTLAHLFRIEQVGEFLRHPDNLFDWTDDWYGGFHQFSLYPYLAYLPAGVLDAITDSPVASMKAIMFAAMVAGGLGCGGCVLLLTWAEIDRLARGIAAGAAALLFIMTPAFLGFMFGFGEYSDFVAIGVAPLLLLLFLVVIRRDSTTLWLLYGASLAVLVLLHPHVGLSAALGHAVLLVFSRHASLRAFIGFAYAGALAFVLSLYFWVPFLLLRDTAGDPSLGTPFTDPIWGIRLGDYFDAERQLRYVGPWILVLAGIGLLAQRYRRDSIALTMMAIAGVVIALGGYLPLSDTLPILDLVNPERGLVALFPAVSVLAGLGVLSIIRGANVSLAPWQAATAAVVVVAFVVADGYFMTERVGRTQEVPDDFVAANRFLEAQAGTPYDRVVVLQDDYNLSAYSPVLSGKAVTEGSQVQGAQTPPDVAKLGAAGPDPEGQAVFVMLASRFHVKWVLADMERRPTNQLMQRLVRRQLLLPVFEQGRYAVFERRWNPSVVRPVGPVVLVIGRDSAVDEIAALSESMDIWAERGASRHLDDYDLATLQQHAIIVLANPLVRDQATVDATLAAYEKGGGRIIRPGDIAPGRAEDSVTFDLRERVIRTQLEGSAPGRAMVSMGYSPFWKVTVDGQTVDAVSHGGFVAFDAAPGGHEIALHYDVPLTHRLGQFASLIGWLAMVGYVAVAAWKWRRGRRTASE